MNQPFFNLPKRCPNLETLKFEEDHNESCTLGLGRPENKFEKLRYVKINKKATWTTLDLVMDRIEQFENADKIILQFKVYDESLHAIKNTIPHHEYKYEKVKRK